MDGLLVPNGDEERLGISIDVLMKDESKRLELGNRAREVQERFSMESVSQIWVNLFDEIRRRNIEIR
jgi:glycosyltransferase involved in cell wall biosynthesis